MSPPRVIPAFDRSPPTVYLGISGILHPSEWSYELVHGRSPWADGRLRYEGVPVLEAALAPWPNVELVLSWTPSRSESIRSALAALDSLAARVVGLTCEDLTNKVKREVATRSGTTRTVGYSSEDYWRMSKAEIVAAHVAWRRPEHWVVLEDEDIGWPLDVRCDRLVLTDPCVGLLSAAMQDRLQTVLTGNFGGYST